MNDNGRLLLPYDAGNDFHPFRTQTPGLFWWFTNPLGMVAGLPVLGLARGVENAECGTSQVPI